MLVLPVGKKRLFHIQTTLDVQLLSLFVVAFKVVVVSIVEREIVLIVNPVLQLIVIVM